MVAGGSRKRLFASDGVSVLRSVDGGCHWSRVFSLDASLDPGSAQDATELSAHFLNRVVATGLDPVAMAAIAGDVAALKAGNYQGAIVKSASDIQNVIQQLIALYTQIVGGTAGVARVAAVQAAPQSGFSVPGFVGSGGSPMGGGAAGSIF